MTICWEKTNVDSPPPQPSSSLSHIPFTTGTHARHAGNGSHEYDESEQHGQHFERRVKAQRILHYHVVVVPRHPRKPNELQRLKRPIDFVLVVQHQTRTDYRGRG